MRNLLALVAVLATGCVLFGAPPCYTDAYGRTICPTPQAVPSHSHVRTDGTILTHADSNYGNATAHEGVAWPWYKTSEATVTTAYTSSYVLDTSARAVLFPRARNFFATVAHNRAVRIQRFVQAGIFARFRR